MLKMGVIEIGADSELSQKMEKDAIDDAIKAANSSFTHGVVQGCNLTLIKIITSTIFTHYFPPQIPKIINITFIFH